MERHSLWIQNDHIKRNFFLKNELKILMLRSIIKNRSISYSRRYIATYVKINLPRISSRTMFSNRCIFSGRVWSVNRRTQTTRFVFRAKANKSFLPGCRRASW